ncbi:uncharacterized protein F5Z01DRAFT_63363 [Emericellopsis atlantica]|uniref:NADH dehydrogenase [ubiquinone] 1 alpha subcomplex subunit n=1 Tax=Emericellopsis atlantica TaxID=2614577 RepID=A0A9P7ZNK5_9HYPO|nr:uncharacterized protein F5Z01DRAFT_63363 [Emericellopsis atlantica]KAG9254976.1 hypothetical protein F5Z01DRAFT_63363 [Emericellopsis atlantica]
MPPSRRIGVLAQSWYRWKALRLPWRRKFLVGFDLNGFTYWEFRLAGVDKATRWRRIVKYPRSTHLSDVHISPQWHQWLRYTRNDPPSVGEQKDDVARQARMRVLAAEADARWAAKPRVMDAPGQQSGQPSPALQSPGAKGPLKQDERQEEKTTQQQQNTKAKEKEDPWAAHRSSGPSENWQPEAWTPGSGKQR